MSKESVVLVTGLLLLIIPLLGLPDVWKKYFIIAAAVLLILVGYSLRHAAFIRSIQHENGERSTDSYVESTRMIDWPDQLEQK